MRLAALRASRDCRCDDGAVARYDARLSGPLLDRIDLHVHVPAGALARSRGPAHRAAERRGARSAWSARARARPRGSRASRGADAPVNAAIPAARLDALVAATPDARALLGRAVDRFGLSARAVHRVLRVARTIADLAERSAWAPGTSARRSVSGCRARA